MAKHPETLASTEDLASRADVAVATAKRLKVEACALRRAAQDAMAWRRRIEVARDGERQ